MIRLFNVAVISAIAFLAFGSDIAHAASDPAIEPGFSTDHSAQRLVLQTIDSANTEIRVLAYEFTSRPIAAALVRAVERRHVKVYVVMDKESTYKVMYGKQFQYDIARVLQNGGVQVVLDGQHTIQHEKVIIADGKTVETGSFNYTDSADKRNAENAIVIRDNPDIAQSYVSEWNTHWKHSERFE